MRGASPGLRAGMIGRFFRRKETDREPFDYTSALTHLVEHIAASHPAFAHVRPDELAVACIRARTSGVHGLYASCRPLRFAGGSKTTLHRGRTYEMPPVVRNGRELLYILYFVLPRFTDLSFELKLVTVFHELYHIGPTFDGDIRRFRGKNYAHGHSRKKFNEKMSEFAEEYLALPGAEEASEFLRRSFRDLERKHGEITATRIRAPRPRRVTEP
ncbi:MAG: putative metallopeptidase [Armatimonadota bacterium]